MGQGEQGIPSPEDPYRKFADTLREKKGVPYATAKLELEEDGEGDWKEFFRGKDLVRYLKEHSVKLDDLVRTNQPFEAQVRDLVHFFIHRGLCIKAQRKFKKPKPGRKRLVKWPRTVVIDEDQAWSEDAFYVWQYDRPTPVWYYVATVALPVTVIAACLFPLAPWWARISLVYLLMGLLLLILGTITLRYAVFTVVWSLTGCSFWLLPNIMSDQIAIVDAFRPVVSFERPKRWSDGWKARLGAGLFVGALVYMLAVHSPNLDHLKEEMAQAHDSLFDYLDLYSKNQTFLAAGQGSGAGAGAAAAGAAGAGAGGAAGAAGGHQQQQQQGSKARSSKAGKSEL